MVRSLLGTRHSRQPHRISIRVRELPLLFNPMDPSPLPEKDLDTETADYIASWADEFPIREPVALLFLVEHAPAGTDLQHVVESAARTYFTSRADFKRLEFRRLMREGQTSLVIGVVFLAACVVLAQWLRTPAVTLHNVFRESLLVAGWVAMWRPLQIYLYEWWPIRRRRRLYDKLAAAPITVKIGTGGAASR